MSDLLPCPFCGESVEIMDYTGKPANCFLLLHRCRVIGPIRIEAYSLSTVQAAWNTRADTLKDAMIEVLAEWVDEYKYPEEVKMTVEVLAQAESEARKRMEVTDGR